MVGDWKNLLPIEKGKEEKPAFQVDKKPPNPVRTKEENR